MNSSADKKPLEVTQEDVDIWVKRRPFGEAFNREFVRRLALAGRLKIVDGPADRLGR